MHTGELVTSKSHIFNIKHKLNPLLAFMFILLLRIYKYFLFTNPTYSRLHKD